MTDFVEPLAPELWFRRLELIASGQMASVENALRHASHLLQLAPIAYREVVRPAIGEAPFEELLNVGDLDGAARHLVAQPLALAFSADGEQALATISCPVLGHPVKASGDTIASAVLRAWTTYLLALRAVIDTGTPRQSSA